LVVQSCNNLSTQETKAGGSEVQCQSI
jgi:hypothetical protein